MGLTGQVSLSKVLFLEQGTLFTPSLATVTPCMRHDASQTCCTRHAFRACPTTLESNFLWATAVKMMAMSVRAPQESCERTEGSYMQEAALEGVDAHDDLSIVAEALLNHQLVHNLLLDVDVAILRAQHHSHELQAQMPANTCLCYPQALLEQHSHARIPKRGAAWST